MSHNLRFYSTILLLLEFAIVAMGVKFVQLFAPVITFSLCIKVFHFHFLNLMKIFNSIVLTTLM